MAENLDKYLELLFRLRLLHFAESSDTFAVVAVEYGYMGTKLLNERLMTPKMYLAKMNNEEDCYQNLTINIIHNALFRLYSH